MTDNTLCHQKRTDNTMTIRKGQTTQCPSEIQTTQWSLCCLSFSMIIIDNTMSEKDRQHNDHLSIRKGQTTFSDHDNTIIVLSVLFNDHCVVCPFQWSLCCLSFSNDHCVVCPFQWSLKRSVLFTMIIRKGQSTQCPFLMVIVLSVLFWWSLCCLSFSMIIVLSVLF